MDCVGPTKTCGSPSSQQKSTSTVTDLIKMDSIKTDSNVDAAVDSDSSSATGRMPWESSSDSSSGSISSQDDSTELDEPISVPAASSSSSRKVKPETSTREGSFTRGLTGFRFNDNYPNLISKKGGRGGFSLAKEKIGESKIPKEFERKPSDNWCGFPGKSLHPEVRSAFFLCSSGVYKECTACLCGFVQIVRSDGTPLVLSNFASTDEEPTCLAFSGARQSEKSSWIPFSSGLSA